MAYIQIGNNYPTSSTCAMILAGLATGWAYGTRTCKWYIKAGSLPTETRYDAMQTASITSGNATSGGNVAFTGLTPGTKYYCRCYVYCTTPEWVAAGGSTTKPITDPISAFEDGSVAMFTTLAGAPTITSISAEQVKVGSGGVNVSWSGTNLAGGEYAIFVDGWTKAEGTMSSNSMSRAIILDEFRTYTIQVWVRNNNTEDSKNVIVTLEAGSANGQNINLKNIINAIGAEQYKNRMAFYVVLGFDSVTNVLGCQYKVEVDGVVAKSGIFNEGEPDIDVDYDWYEVFIDNIEVSESKQYAVKVTLSNSFSSDSETTSITIKAVAGPSSWSWSDIESGVAVNTIIYTRWNDFCNRILEWLQYKKMTNYIPLTTSYGSATSLQDLIAEAKMTSSDKILTANRFNITKLCVYQLRGNTTLDKFVPVNPRAPVLASYFTTLASELNNTPR